MTDTLSPLERAAEFVPTWTTFRQLSMLSILERHGDDSIGVKHMAQLVGVAKPVVTRAFDQFERYGFAARGSDVMDGRLAPLRLLPAGRTFIRAVNAELSRVKAM